MFKYIHNIDAYVEDGIKYLTDVVKVSMEEVGEEFVVSAYPAIQTGVETVNSVPVHPKTVSEEIEVPVYAVPTTLKVLVRVSPFLAEQDTSNGNHNNWKEKEVTVTPLVLEKFEEESDAIAFYESVAGQLAEGDALRHLPHNKPLRSTYDAHNGRY